ncbi:MAG: hypothetical protein EOO65_01730 [Methanosarcinales archaeon]|nr:MAG: hypothetical protein EOO65_01730 [Methanosarcinales archaeon]
MAGSPSKMACTAADTILAAGDMVEVHVYWFPRGSKKPLSSHFCCTVPARPMLDDFKEALRDRFRAPLAGAAPPYIDLYNLPDDAEPVSDATTALVKLDRVLRFTSSMFLLLVYNDPGHGSCNSIQPS